MDYKENGPFIRVSHTLLGLDSIYPPIMLVMFSMVEAGRPCKSKKGGMEKFGV